MEHSERPRVVGWQCPTCTLVNSPGHGSCDACGYRRRGFRVSGSRNTIVAVPRSSREGFASVALRAAIAGAAGLALGRASVHSGMHRAAVTALAVAAVPLANLVLSRLLGPPGSSGSGGRVPPRSSGGREQRRRQLLRAAQAAAEQAAAAGGISAEEQALLALVMQPAQSRPERVRTIARVLEGLQAVEASPAPRSRSTQLVSALVVHELNSLVDEMDYEELHAAFGGHPPSKGLDEAQIAALPEARLTAEAVAALHSGACPVCLDAFEPGQAARVLPGCAHSFHTPCLDTWLRSKAVCPVCRAAVEPPGAHGPHGEAGSGPGAALLPLG